MTSRTTTLPLFPLSLVLFPGMTLPLHVFEERYKRMINLCLREARDFGVVLAGAATGVPGRCLTYPVGTTAHITGATRFPDGCMNLITTGQRRFRIHALDWDLEYCVAGVEWIAEAASDAEALRLRAERRWSAFRQRDCQPDERGFHGRRHPRRPDRSILCARRVAADQYHREAAPPGGDRHDGTPARDHAADRPRAWRACAISRHRTARRSSRPDRFRDLPRT